MARFHLLLPLALLLAVDTAPGLNAQQTGERDALEIVRAIDGTRARQAWPGFDPTEWPIAVFDGRQTVLLRHPSPPPEFTVQTGQPGVFTMRGRHPAVVVNSTRDIAGVRTATVIATPGQALDNILLAYVEEVFHVFFLRRHPNVRPNEMVRYGYPVSDAWNRERILAENEALARALDAISLREAASWARAALQIRHERAGQRSAEEQAFETELEMMEGTANYVARAAVGQALAATSARLREPRGADAIRWRFYDSGASLCFLLDRFSTDWKSRLDAEPGVTIADLLEAAIMRTAEGKGKGEGAGAGAGGSEAQPVATFSDAESSAFERRASTDIAELSARQRQLRDELRSRPGQRIVIEVASTEEPLRLTRFDPINLLVLGEGEVAHAHYLAFTGHDSTIELTNPAFARGTFAGTVALTRAAGPHPFAGIRTVTIAGINPVPRIDRRDEGGTIEAEGVRISFRNADVRVDGDTVHVRLPRRP